MEEEPLCLGNGTSLVGHYVALGHLDLRCDLPSWNVALYPDSVLYPSPVAHSGRRIFSHPNGYFVFFHYALVGRQNPGNNALLKAIVVS